MIVRALVVAAVAALALSACGEGAPESPEPQAPAAPEVTARATPAPAQPVPTATVAATPAATAVPSPAATTAATLPATAPSPAVTTSAATPRVAASAASAAVDAANAFLDALGADQRSAALLALDSPLRPNWSNLPPSMTRFDHNGVRIGDLDAGQTELMHDFLRAALSPDGYAKVVGIVGAEDALAASSGRQLSADNYWLAFFGEPSANDPWGWQFGGHHLAVNVTVVDGRGPTCRLRWSPIRARLLRRRRRHRCRSPGRRAGGRAGADATLSTTEQTGGGPGGRPPQRDVGGRRQGRSRSPPLEGSRAVPGWSEEQREPC